LTGRGNVIDNRFSDKELITFDRQVRLIVIGQRESFLLGISFLIFARFLLTLGASSTALLCELLEKGL
jgi:hypothetical protein